MWPRCSLLTWRIIDSITPENFSNSPGFHFQDSKRLEVFSVAFPPLLRQCNHGFYSRVHRCRACCNLPRSAGDRCYERPDIKFSDSGFHCRGQFPFSFCRIQLLWLRWLSLRCKFVNLNLCDVFARHDNKAQVSRSHVHGDRAPTRYGWKRRAGG